jgi:hypothetical protein
VKAITDLFKLRLVQLTLEGFNNYLMAIENFLEDQVAELNNRVAIEKQHLKQNGDYARELAEWGITPGDVARLQFEEDYVALHQVFPGILRKSFFLTVYSVLEAGLNDCCNLLAFQGTSLKDVEDPPDKSIRRARKYLTDIAMVDFPDSREWKEITKYQKLRNCIVHNEGRLSGCQHSEFLTNYISRNLYLELTQCGDTFVIRKAFCEEVLQTVRGFFRQLESSFTFR